jgi:hypothetical protein
MSLRSRTDFSNQTTPSLRREEFALNGQGRNGIALALRQYQQQIDQTLREMGRLRLELATKEKQLADAQAMPKDPLGSYWQWDSAERSGRTIYLARGETRRPFQNLWWEERYMHRQHANEAFRVLPTPVSGSDPYPQDGVVVQSIHGILYVPSKLIRSLFDKAIQGLPAGEADDVRYEETYQGLHAKLGYLLERMQHPKATI